MRYWIIAVVLFVLIAVAAYFFWPRSAPTITPTGQATLPISPSNTSTIGEQGSPNQFVASCYTWYLQLLAEANNTQSDPSAILSQCFTQAFITSWNSETTEDYNPVVIAQTPPADWAQSVVTNNVASNQVEVDLGSGSDQEALLVTLQQEAGVLKISNVSLKN